MKLFISYAHVDEYIVQQVVHILTEANYEPWFDRALKVGIDWKEQLAEAIRDSDAFVYALSPESVNSEWCQWEFAQAVSLGKTIIPVLLQRKTELPDTLSRYQYADFTQGPTGQAVAKLMGGLREISVTIPKDSVKLKDIEPTGKPAQVRRNEDQPTILPLVQMKKPSSLISDIFKRFISPRRRIFWTDLRCPRCLALLETDQSNVDISCPNCYMEIPGAFVANYQTANPFFIQVFGWTGHGKTVYLNALRLVLSEMQSVWDRYIYQPIDESAKLAEVVIHRSTRYGGLASATSLQSLYSNTAELILLDGLPRWGSRTLVVMDHGGEWFHSHEVPIEEMPYLTKVPITFMMISLPTLLRSAQDGFMQEGRIDWLLNIYISALLSNGVDFDKDPRKLVVIFTIGDKLHMLPTSLKEYLMSDDLSPSSLGKLDQHRSLKDLSAYLREMHQISDQIEQWIFADRKFAPGGANFVNLTRKYGIEVKYTAVSAFGRNEPLGDEALRLDPMVEIAPKRVLDPLFWGLELESQLLT